MSGGPGDRPAVARRSVRGRLFGARAAVVIAVLAGLFGMHGLSVGHASMTMDASVTARGPMARTVPVLPGPGGTSGVAPLSVLPGQAGAGGPEHTGTTPMTPMTPMTCVAVLAAAVVLVLLVCRRVFARRRAGPRRPARARVAARRLTPRVFVVPEALSLIELCVMRV